MGDRSHTKIDWDTGHKNGSLNYKSQEITLVTNERLGYRSQELDTKRCVTRMGDWETDQKNTRLGERLQE